MFITGYCLVREISTAGIISTVAGTHASCGFSGDGGPATSALLFEPYGVAVKTVSGVDQIYIADYINLRIRKAALAGISIPWQETAVFSTRLA